MNFIFLRDKANSRLNTERVIDYAPLKSGDEYFINIAVGDSSVGIMYAYESKEQRDFILEEIDCYLSVKDLIT